MPSRAIPQGFQEFQPPPRPKGFQLLEPTQESLTSGAKGNGGRKVVPVAPAPDAARGFEDDGLYSLIGTQIYDNLMDLLHRNPEVRRTALEWFLDPETRPPSVIGPMTFGWICEVTGTEPTYLLRKLREEVVDRAKAKARRGKVSLATYLERLQPFLASEKGGHP